MVLRMKRFNIFGVHWKIWLLGARGSGVMKNQYRGRNCLKRGLRQFADLRGGLARKRRMVFLRGIWYLNAHYDIYIYIYIYTYIYTYIYIYIKVIFSCSSILSATKIVSANSKGITLKGLNSRCLSVERGHSIWRRPNYYQECDNDKTRDIKQN